MFCKIKCLAFFICFSTFIFAQKIDTDSLLLVTNNSFSKEMNYIKTIQLAHLGIKNAPNYLDFHLVLGRAYQKTNQMDSARYYYKHIILTNTKYKEAFLLLAKLETDQKNFELALVEIDNGIAFYPNEVDFYKQKYQILNQLNDTSKTGIFLKEAKNKFPEETYFSNAIKVLEDLTQLDKIGITYSYTSFNRDNYGPWHYSNIEYARQREKITLIARVNFTDRRLNGSSAVSGFLYEIESYFKNNAKSYSYLNFGFSNDDRVFPKIRTSYSYFHNLGKGWETELGIRYSKRTNQENFSGVMGLGKYFGSHWLNLRTFGQINEKKVYPSFSILYRYYFKTRYDYFSLFTGYGTSPDERETLTLFQDRIDLNSKRIGMGYNRQFNNRYYIGLQGNFNIQEYYPTKYQNEITISLSLNYKL